jgi:hypothetical protein
MQTMHASPRDCQDSEQQHDLTGNIDRVGWSAQRGAAGDHARDAQPAIGEYRTGSGGERVERTLPDAPRPRGEAGDGHEFQCQHDKKSHNGVQTVELSSQPKHVECAREQKRRRAGEPERWCAGSLRRAQR